VIVCKTLGWGQTLCGGGGVYVCVEAGWVDGDEGCRSGVYRGGIEG